MKQYWIFGAAIVVVAILVFAVFNSAATEPFDETGCEDCGCTIYIEDASGNVMSADVPLSALTFSEGMMLSFGQGVREVPFTLETYTTTAPALSKTAAYKMYAEVTFTLNAESTANIQATYSGLAGATCASCDNTAPNHATSASPLITPTGESSVTMIKYGAVSGTTYTISQNGAVDGENDKFTQFNDGSVKTLTGDQVDGSVITVILTATIDGQVITAEADLTIKVNGWGSSSMSIVISGMSGRGI